MDDTKKNAYTILELEPSPDLDDAAIKKAYRRLAIIRHPDKNRGNPKAAEEFAELEQAYRLLLDKAARGALDDLLRAQAQRVARESQVSDKRRKLREELERRERQSASERSEEEIARQRLKVELERLRRKAEEEERRQRQQAAELSAMLAVHRAANAAAAAGDGSNGAAGARGGSGADTSTSYGGAEPAAIQAQLRRTLKVTWDPTCRQYSTEELRSIFGAFGAPVEDVVLRDQKKKRKATALVVMGSETAAATAAGTVCGDPSDPLLVVPLVAEPTAGPEGLAEAEAAAAAPVAPGVEGRGAATSSGTGGGSGPGEGEDGLLPRNGPVGPTGAAGAGPAHSLLQRPVRLPEPAAGGRPLFPTAGKPAFPVAGGGLFPSSTTGNGAAAAGPGLGAGFPSAAGPGRPTFPAGVGASAFPSWKAQVPAASGVPKAAGGGGGGGGSSFEDEVLEKMRRAAAARQAAAAAGSAAEEKVV